MPIKRCDHLPDDSIDEEDDEEEKRIFASIDQHKKREHFFRTNLKLRIVIQNYRLRINACQICSIVLQIGKLWLRLFVGGPGYTLRGEPRGSQESSQECVHFDLEFYFSGYALNNQANSSTKPYRTDFSSVTNHHQTVLNAVFYPPSIELKKSNRRSKEQNNLLHSTGGD